MRSTNELLAYLQTLDIQLWVEQGRLRFNAPQGVMNPELKAEITSHKAAIIELLSRPNLTSAPIPLVSRQQNLELSFTQRRLWFLYQLDQDIAAYLLRYNLKLRGVLNIDFLEQSLTEIVSRHEILRTNFVEIEGNPFQIIHPPKPFKLSLIDLQGLVATERETELHRLANQESQTAFNLEKDELLRVTLLRLAPQEHILLITFHHVIADAWSIGIFLRELSSLYKSFIEAQPVTLPNLPIQYADFAQWQNQHLTKDTLVDQITYWEKQLAGIPPVLELPTDRPRPPVQTFNGGAEFFEISAELTDRLKKLSQKSGATLFMTIITTFFILLARYTGEEDIVVGIPIANRMRVEFESLMGCFVNSLVLRSQLHGNPTFLELLQQVRQTALNAYAHQDLPFEQLVEALQPERSLSHSPLFQVMFAWENVQMESLDLPNVQIEPFKTDHFTARADLNVEMMETDRSLQGLFEYNSDLFDAETIKRMVGHFQNLLEAIAINPDQKIYNLPLLTKLESQQILIDWNDTASNYPQNICLHELVEAQVERTPDAIAVTYEDQQLSYQELNQKANQLSHYLRKQGVKPDQPVGICIERSLEMVIGLLGILKAGGAYVPIDPTYPKDRLSLMFADSQVSVLLTQQKLLAQLPEHTAQTLCLDSEWTLCTDESDLNPPRLSKAEHLCYIIYTSGSTGKPKGAMNNHRGVVNRLLWMQSTYQIDISDCILQKTPFSFDVSVWEFFWTLSTGAKLVIAKPEGHKDTSYLKQLIIQAGITTLHFVPSMLQVFLEAETDLSKCSSLKRVICSGEALPSDLQRRFFERLDCELHNLYGPTEAAIDVSYWQCQANSHLSTVPIGKPVANTQLYVLDNYLQPVPIGVAGELHIGGVQVGRGYLNRPELSAEKFIHDPFSSDPDARLYKTGDRVRYLADGVIEYLGRIDFQVKLRGFRIELGEIEAILKKHIKIQQAVVLIKEDVHDNKRLIAYVVSEDKSLSINQLREFVKCQLPEYMVPSTFIVLDSLPLSPNGKLDRKALPIDNGEIAREHEYVAPSSSVEKALTTIWQELLLKERFSIHDNFFEIGGDSILSIQVVSRAKNLGMQITPKQIFQNQTIAELARVVNTQTHVIAQQGIVTGSASLTPIQKWFFSKNREEVHHYNQSLLLKVPNHLQNESIEIALKKLLEHHDALRLRFTSISSSEYRQNNHSFDDTVAFSVIDLSLTPKPSQSQALSQIATEFQARLNLAEGSLMQVVKFDLGNEDDARLLIIIHHLAVDGVSWRILLSDLETIYQQTISQQPIKLSSKTTAFIDWAEKLKNYAQSEIIKDELSYWLTKPWESVKSIPTDYSHSHQANTYANATSVVVKLSMTETRTLLESVNEVYNTQINDILLSALVISLVEWTNNSTILIDLEGHGREELFPDVDLSRTVGWFTSLFPVILQAPESLDQIEKVIKSIKEQLRAIPHNGIGYGILKYLCDDINIQQQLQVVPNSEIIFNYLGQFDQLQLQTGWKFASESTGANRSLKQDRDYSLDINAIVMEGELSIDWNYSTNIHSHETIKGLALKYLKAIRKIIEHCQVKGVKGYTPSDFPNTQLNQTQLDELLTTLNIKNISSIYPLSPMQQGMLFHSLYSPESGAYFEQMTLSLLGNINVDAFKLVWEKLVDRHSILRTSFIWTNLKTPLQVSLKQIDLPWIYLDWQKLSLMEQQQQLLSLLQAQKEQGFCLNQAPLMRLVLIQLKSDTYKLVWSYHHILLDGWCLPIVLRELLNLYKAAVEEVTCELPTPIPYKDYIAWLNEQDQELSTQFWEQNLQGFNIPTPLVVDKICHQNPHQTSTSQELELYFSHQVSLQLKSLVQQHRVTLSTIVKAAWGLLLSRYSSEQDVVFGVTVSGRDGSLSGVENMVGLLINTLPLRLQISPQQPVVTWLKQIQQAVLEIQQYSYTSLFEIQSRSAVPKGMSLFDSIVVFENYPVDSSLLHGDDSLKISQIEGSEQTNYPLTVVAMPGDRLLIKVSYYTARFGEDTIRRMLGHLQTIISAIAENPNQTVGEVPLLSETERHQLLDEWSYNVTEYPQHKCIHQLFEEQAAKTPKAIAVVYEDQQISYQELNQRANQLARHLQTLGVREEELVGICVERSLDMLVGLLGILKAGAAYVPIDTSYPPERIAYMLEDAQIQVLVTQQGLGSKFENSLVQIVCLDSGWTEIAVQSQENLPSLVTSRNLACVIYTSGSTGEPKGVALEHRGVNRLAINTNYMQLSAGDRVAQASNISFDAATLEIWGAMLNGCTLIILSKDIVLSPQKLALQISQHQITTLFLTTALLNQIAKQSPAIFKSIKNLMFGGEASDPSAIRELLKADSPERIVHLYGPAENTTLSSWYLVKDIDPEATTIPIGQAIANSQIYILDQYQQPVPIGVIGEIYVGGDGLARGYINRPELTAEKFIRHPFSQDPAERLYKTGDLGRYLRDGNIEFVGRSDFQVKIRGFRIEIGEIETILGQHPEIQEILVIALDDTRGSKQLVAYVVPKIETPNTADLTGRTLKRFLKEKLPDYMIPAFFVFLDELPLTPNGKVDRRALPTPDLASPSLESSFVAPSTATEQAIAKVWQEILKIEQIGIHDNFFELGGHSLIATQVMSRLPQIFSLDLPLSLLFELPTIAELGDRIDTILWASGSSLLASSDGSNADEEDEYTEGLL